MGSCPWSFLSIFRERINRSLWDWIADYINLYSMTGRDSFEVWCTQLLDNMWISRSDVKNTLNRLVHWKTLRIVSIKKCVFYICVTQIFFDCSVFSSYCVCVEYIILFERFDQREYKRVQNASVFPHSFSLNSRFFEIV